jgi:hypothetical protein
VLQRCSGKILLFGNCAQQAIGVHGSKVPHSKMANAVPEIVAPDFLMTFARARSTLLFGPWQVSCLNEVSQRNPRIGAEPIAGLRFA